MQCHRRIRYPALGKLQLPFFNRYDKNIKGVIMGQRRGDPWTESMDFFTPSTPGWAKFTRVNPALEWKFCHVWRFLRSSGLPYCVLYDQG